MKSDDEYSNFTVPLPNHVITHINNLAFFHGKTPEQICEGLIANGVIAAFSLTHSELKTLAIKSRGRMRVTMLLIEEKKKQNQKNG